MHGHQTGTRRRIGAALRHNRGKHSLSDPALDHDNPVSRTGPLPCLQAGRAQPQGTKDRQGTPRNHPPGQIARLKDVHLLNSFTGKTLKSLKTVTLPSGSLNWLETVYSYDSREKLSSEMATLDGEDTVQIGQLPKVIIKAEEGK